MPLVGLAATPSGVEFMGSPDPGVVGRVAASAPGYPLSSLRDGWRKIRT